MSSANRLDVFKTLGDNTRYAIYLEIARSPNPLSTTDVADSLELHPNTVRPHLERMREVGLLDSTLVASGTVGRPQKRYAIRSDAPSLGLEPPAYPRLTRMLLDLLGESEVPGDAALQAGREEGARLGHESLLSDRDANGIEAVKAMHDTLGFDPEVLPHDDGATIAFLHCPFAEQAEANPNLICALHHGMIEGFAAVRGDSEVTEFSNIIARTPCQVELV